MTSQEEYFRRLISLHRGNEVVLHCIVNHVCVTGSFTEIIIHVLLGELIFTVLSWYLAAWGQRRQDRCKCWSILYICHWLFSGKCLVRDCKFGIRTLNQKTDNRVHVSICSLKNVPFPLLPQTFTEPFLLDTKPVLSYEILRLTTLHAPAPCSFNFTHPPVLSALLLILPASRFLVADFPLLVPVPFSVFGPSSLKDLSLPLSCRLSFTLEIYICNTMSSEFLISL